MRLAVAGAGLAMLAGCGQYRATPPADPDAVWMGGTYGSYRKAGLLALQAGKYREAIAQYTAGAEAARRGSDAISRGRFLTNLSAAYLLLFENRPAIEALLAARDAAAAGGDLATLQTVEASLANVYIQTGDSEAATEAAMRGAAVHPARQLPQARISILMSFGRAMARTKGLAAAEPLFREAYQTAEGLGLVSLEAEALELWGNEATETGQLEQAEDLLARAWCLRKAARDERISLTEGKIGRLYRKRGRYEAARMWMDRVRVAMASGRKIPVPEWVIMAEAGHIYAGEGRLDEAMRSYREAVGFARKWRQALPPAERLRLGGERRLQELVEGQLVTAARMYRRRPDPQWTAEMFALIQTTRAWSVDKSRDGGLAEDGLYARARRLEGRWLGGDRAAVAELKVVRAAILEKEAAGGAGGDGDAAGRLEAPEEGEAVLTFWLHDEGSWVWLWTREGLRVAELAGRKQIVAEAERFREAVARNSGERAELGERLMEALLGRLRAECLRARRLDIVADDGLFGVPFAALPGGDGKFLVERAEIRLIPNALRRAEAGAPERRFLAVADPIFNAADERRGQSWFGQRRVHAGQAALELPRLPGTRREAEAAREAWGRAGFATAMQLGEESSEEAVLGRLGEWQPGVIHIATHTVTPAGDEARPRLALSLRADGSPGLLTAEDIASLRLRAGLVVMSACRSTGSQTAPGAGLLGLTRAWLTAGTRQVVATLWPVGDESTAFFHEFHGHLASDGRLNAAEALRQAQLHSLQSGAEPREWAGHVLLARR